MKRDRKTKTRDGCSEVIEEDRENALSDYEGAAEMTANGKYRCRDCGMLFETFEAHDEHHRKVHRQEVTYPGPGTSM